MTTVSIISNRLPEGGSMVTLQPHIDADFVISALDQSHDGEDGLVLTARAGTRHYIPYGVLVDAYIIIETKGE